MRKQFVAILVTLSSFFLCAILSPYNANAQTQPTGEDAKRLFGLWRLEHLGGCQTFIYCI